MAFGDFPEVPLAAAGACGIAHQESPRIFAFLESVTEPCSRPRPSKRCSVRNHASSQKLFPVLRDPVRASRTPRRHRESEGSVPERKLLVLLTGQRAGQHVSRLHADPGGGTIARVVPMHRPNLVEAGLSRLDLCTDRGFEALRRTSQSGMPARAPDPTSS